MDRVVFPDTRDARNACPTTQSRRNIRRLSGIPQATNLVNRTCFRLGTMVATIANLAMPDKIMIAGESSFIAKFGIDDLRNGINMYRHSQAAPVDFEIPDHDWALWAKAAAAQAIRQYVG